MYHTAVYQLDDMLYSLRSACARAVPVESQTEERFEQAELEHTSAAATVVQHYDTTAVVPARL